MFQPARPHNLAASRILLRVAASAGQVETFSPQWRSSLYCWKITLCDRLVGLSGPVLAKLPGMIVSILDLQSAPERRTEVLQTLASLAQMIREAKGCLRCSLCQQCGDDDAFTIIEEWRSREEFDEHIRSRSCSILLGLKPLLRKPMEVSICTIAARERMEVVRRARSRALAHGA